MFQQASRRGAAPLGDGLQGGPRPLQGHHNPLPVDATQAQTAARAVFRLAVAGQTPQNGHQPLGQGVGVAGILECLREMPQVQGGGFVLGQIRRRGLQRLDDGDLQTGGALQTPV